MEYTIKITAYSKKELAKFYCVSPPTFRLWIKNIPNLNVTKEQRILTPKQVALIFETLGTPKSA